MSAAAEPTSIPAAWIAMLQALPDACFIVDAEGRVVAANRLAATLFGYQEAEVLGMTVDAFLPTEIALHHRELRRAFLGNPGRRGPVIGRARHRNGHALSVEINLNPLPDEAGAGLVVAVIRDLTARRALERSLRTREAELAESQQWLGIMHGAVTALPLPVAIGTADDLRIEYVNQAFLDQFAYERIDSVVGQPAAIVASDPVRQQEVFHQALASGAVVSDALGVRRDGTPVPLLVAVSRLPDTADARPRLVASFVDLTERERAADELRRREQWLRAMLDGFPIAAALIAVESRRRLRAAYANRRFHELFGHDGGLPAWDELCARWCPDPDEWRRTLRRARHLASAAWRTGSRTGPIEMQLTGASGQRLDLLLTVTPVGGQLLAVFRDVTSARRAERRFRHVLDATAPATGELFLSSLTQHLREGLDCDYAYVGEFDADTIQTLSVHGPDGPETNFTYSIADTPCAPGAPCNGGAWARGLPQNARRHDFLRERGIAGFACQQLIASTGERLGVLAVMHRKPFDDVDAISQMLQIFAGRAGAEIERARADGALQALTDQLEERVRDRTREVRWQAAAMDNATEGFTIVAGQQLQYVNRAFARMVGREDPRDIIGSPWTVLHEAAEAERLVTVVAPALLQDKRWSGVSEIRRRDGGHLTVDCGAAAIADGNVVVAYRDITQRLAMEHALQRSRDDLRAANAQLVRADRAKDEFLAAVSHELRTPLNAVLGISEALADSVYGEVGPRQREALAHVEEAGRHLLDIINDLLDVSKIESGHLLLDVGEVDVRAACDSSLQVIRNLAAQKRVALTARIAPDVGTVAADRRRLQQILLNLLGNAVKFTPAGGRVGLEVAHDARRAAIDFIVRDTGIGIAAEQLGHIFEPFTQIDRGLDREYAGTGLGLALVRRLVDMHGGSIAVVSEPGRGSAFTVSLPVTAAAVDRAARPPAEPSPAPTHDPQGDVILIADDNSENAAFLRDYLETIGYRVVLAFNGHEAVDRAVAEHPALILMDVQMPGLDGLEATRAIRAAVPRHIPIIACTALAMPGDRERCLAAGADDYLAKPVPLKEVRATIGAHLARAAEQA